MLILPIQEKHPNGGSNGLMPLLLYLLQIENYIKESMKMEMAQLQQSAVHNHTAAMLEMGTNLLSQTAEQTRKLTDVETQVMPARRCHTHISLQLMGIII